MRRQIWLYAKWVLVVAGAIAVFAITAAGGGGCGVCRTTRGYTECERGGCNQDCTAGVCFCETWNRRECVGSGNDCKGEHIGNVPVTVGSGHCLPIGPTGCFCSFDNIFRELRPRVVCTPCP